MNEEDNETMDVLEKLGEIWVHEGIFIVKTKDGNEIYGDDYISYVESPKMDKETVHILFDGNVVARIYIKTIKDVVEWNTQYSKG